MCFGMEGYWTLSWQLLSDGPELCVCVFVCVRAFIFYEEGKHEHCSITHSLILNHTVESSEECTVHAQANKVWVCYTSLPSNNHNRVDELFVSNCKTVAFNIRYNQLKSKAGVIHMFSNCQQCVCLSFSTSFIPYPACGLKALVTTVTNT